MVSAEPHIYITVPSLRIWIRNNRGTALAAAAVAAAVLAVAVILGVFLAL